MLIFSGTLMMKESCWNIGGLSSMSVTMIVSWRVPVEMPSNAKIVRA